jgi:hypothetical protein
VFIRGFQNISVSSMPPWLILIAEKMKCFARTIAVTLIFGVAGVFALPGLGGEKPQSDKTSSDKKVHAKDDKTQDDKEAKQGKAEEEKKDGRFEVHGVFSIVLPEGYKCDGKNMAIDADRAMYICSKKGHVPLLITVKDSNTDNEEKRKSEISDYLASMEKMFKAAGKWKLVDKEVPKEIADRVFCTITAEGPDGKPVYYATLIVFGKKTLFLQASGLSSDETQQLVKTIEPDFKVLVK